ncbi:hypothetical protein [Candidatus Arthromitus sp. SFB-rat-Yit]|uniref:hypothetical protein n=1 Tax=Candidatus Arthromitus sp. SFB-rat-Yit TaxID=1041504 RepID=UPI00031C076D|nr:hypothetical protein [Candidatus Arthromitus sp. SFB-rat-Yit]
MDNNVFKRVNREVFDNEVPFSIYEIEKIILGDNLSSNFRGGNGSYYKIEEILDK